MPKHSESCVIDQDQIVPEEYTTYFRSVILFGTIRILEGDVEKLAAIEKLTEKYTPDDSADNRKKAIERDWKPLCMLEMAVEHMSGKEAIELARFCEQQQQLAHAVDLYRDVLICGGITSLQQHKRSAEAALARQAYKALVRLSESDDEYVWEMCSQTVGDLHYLFDEASDN